MAGLDNVSWIAWGLTVLGFFIVIVGTLVGPPRRVPAPWVMFGAVVLMFVGFSVSLVAGAAEGETVVALRFGALLALLLVLVLVARARHVRAKHLST